MSLALARTLALVGAAALAPAAQATTQVVTFNVLNAAATLPTPLQAGDSLRLDTLVTTQTGPLVQDITFTLAPGVGSFTGQAAWEISTPAGPGPRLIGVNIDIFDAANVLVASDTFAGTLAGYGLSTFAGAIGPGTYRLHATGTGVRESSLDVTLSFLTAVPEPRTYALFLAGLGVLAFISRRRA